MSTYKFCQAEITWQKVEGKSVPYNIDGTPHKCKKDTAAAAAGTSDVSIGELRNYNSGSATFRMKESFKTYALHPSMQKEWQDAGFLIPFENHPEVWLEFTLDKNKFIQSGWKRVQKPAWGVVGLPAEQPATQPAPQKTVMKNPAGTPVSAAQKPPVINEKDVWSAECEEFKVLLASIERDGIKDLLTYLGEETDFFIAPSSTKYHDARDGGLLHHSLKTYHNLVALSKIFAGEYEEDSLKIIGLLHDLCKANFYTTSIRNKKVEGTWVQEPYIDIDDQLPLGHGEKSVILLQRYIPLTNIEIMGIRWHMMAYDDLHYSYAGNLAITNASGKYPIIVLMHIADLSASFLEVRPASENPAGAV